MSLLLDTHVLIWTMMDPHKLSRTASTAMRSKENELIVSAVSLIEIAIKVQSGKLQIPMSRDYMSEHFSEIGISRILDITSAHAYTMLTIPRLHGDPFDRLLVAQCVTENMRLVTADRVFKKYPVNVLW